MNSSDSAEELVKISLDGMEVALKIAGEGAKNLAVIIYTIIKNKQQTKGKTRLTNMLKTGKTLKIFTIKAEDLKKFSQEAKKYGVLYCALADKKNSKIDGMVDIMVREEDASKINRIAERFNFADVATIEKELQKEKEKQQGQLIQDKDTKEKTKEELIAEELLAKPTQNEKQQKETTTPSNNPKDTEEKSQSENFLDTKQDDNNMIKKESKKSVREELKQIEKEQQEKLAKEREYEVIEVKNNQEKKKPKHLKENEGKKKPKHLKEPKHLDTQNRKKKKSKKKERSK